MATIQAKLKEHGKDLEDNLIVDAKFSSGNLYLDKKNGSSHGPLQPQLKDANLDPGTVMPVSKVLGIESIKNIGSAGQPAFYGGLWDHFRPNGNEVFVGYWRDPFTKLVHVRGSAYMATNPDYGVEVFTLPPGYRPIDGHCFIPVLMYTGATFINRVISIATTGEVVVQHNLSENSVVYFGGGLQVSFRYE